MSSARPNPRVATLESWLIALAVVTLGVAAAAVAKPRAGGSAAATWAAIVLLVALPWSCPPRPVAPRVVVTVVCVALLVPKMVDALIAPGDWHGRPWRQWLGHLPTPCVLVYRGREALPVAPARRTPRRLLIRATLQMATGTVLLVGAMRADLGVISFWFEHGVKLVAIYLLGFDGAFLLLEGITRACGVAVIDQTRDPIRATTPADFWRRYNREAGRFFYENVFKRIGGPRRPRRARRPRRPRHPRRAIVLTFLVNGALHEYLGWLIVGSIQGYQFTFFALHGLATAATYDVRPRGTVARVIGMTLTLLFLYVTSVLFFASVSQFMPWYDRGPVRPW